MFEEISGVNRIPMFSIIIPVYNRDYCIERAIKSVIDQSYCNWELIIIDDGSSDDTFKIITRWVNQDERIKGIHLEKNEGVSNARNIGIDASIGQYLLFLDSDDVFVSGMFGFLNMALKGNDSIDIIICNIARFDNKEKDYIVDNNSIRLLSKSEIDNSILPLMIGIIPNMENVCPRFVVWNKCFRAKLIKDNYIKFNAQKRTREDKEFCIRTIEKSNVIATSSNNIVIDRRSIVNNHLSTLFYNEGVEFSLQEYKWLLESYGSKYDFFNEYTLERTYKEFEFWINGLVNDNEKHRIIDLYKDSDYRQLILKRKKDGVFQKIKSMFLLIHCAYGAYQITLLQKKLNDKRSRRNNNVE